MKSNYHTHIALCNHATGMPEDYVLEAIDKNMDILGFSDHAPYPNNEDPTRMEYEQLEFYKEEVEKVKEKYKGKIIIKSGLEIEYAKHHINYYEELLNKYKFDYLVLGQHFYDVDGKQENSYIMDNSSQLFGYANSVIEGMKTGYFKFLAHPDVVFINDIAWDENCDKFCDMIAKAAKENDFILEFNANGVRRGLREYKDGQRYSYPHLKFWERIAKDNIKVVINADCHNLEHLWDSAMDKSYEIAKELGLNIVTEIF